MYISLAIRGGHTNGKLFQCTAVSAHGMPFKMGKHQHGVIIYNILSYKVFPDGLTARYIQFQIRAFTIQQVYFKTFAPSMLIQRFQMPLSRISGTFVSSIAFHHRTAYKLDHRLEKLRFEKVLISFFARMKLDSHPAVQFPSGHFVQFQHHFRADSVCKIYFRFHRPCPPLSAF